MSWRTAFLGAACVMAGAALQAHHSISGVYDFRQQVTLGAVVVEFEFVNPHPFITVDAGENGREGGRWRLEMDNRRELAELGFREDTLQRGDRLRLTVNPARKEPGRGYVRRLVRPADGFTYQHHD